MSATIPETMLLSDLLKATGYDCPVSMQGKTFAECTTGDQPSVLEDNKEVEITTNGTVVITPTAGHNYEGMKKVTAEVNIPAVLPAALLAWKSEGDAILYTLVAKPTTTDKAMAAGEGTISTAAITAYDEATDAITVSDTAYVRYSTGDVSL